jgi:hypothetical protein
MQQISYSRILGGVIIGFGIIMAMICGSPFQSKKTSYIYSPGLLGSPVLVGRYCPYSVAYTGEVIFGTKGGNIMGSGDCITAARYAEIDTKKSEDWFRSNVGRSVFEKILGSFGIFVRENHEGEETIFNYIVDLKKVNIGQKVDIGLLRKAYEEHCARYPGTQIVLMGDSRGAATIFNFIAEDHPAIACAIMEGVFDSMPHVIKHHFCSEANHSVVEWGLESVLKICAGNYSREGAFPEHYVDHFPFDTPALLVTSEKDETVGHQCTMRLYRLLLEHGHTNIRLLILPNSCHKTYMVGEDREMYECCVHAFYKDCGVEYNVEKAARGQSTFEQTRPSLSELEKKYKIAGECCCEPRGKLSASGND